MRSRPKAAITTTVWSRPEPTSSAGTRFRRKAIPSRATAKRCEPTERLGSPVKGRRHNERVLLMGRRAMRTSIRASGTFVSAPTGRRHDRTRSVRKASTKPLTTGRQWYGPRPPGAGYDRRSTASREKCHAGRSHWFGSGEICLRDLLRRRSWKDGDTQDASSSCGFAILRKPAHVSRRHGGFERRALLGEGDF